MTAATSQAEFAAKTLEGICASALSFSSDFTCSELLRGFRTAELGLTTLPILPTAGSGHRQVLETFHTCPIPEVARLGRTLRRWRTAFLAYFTTHRSSNGGTEAINGIIELHRRLARGYRNRDNYRLRMLLTAGGLTP